MIYTKKMLLPALLLVSGSQNAMAISSYNNETSITYAISAINQNTATSLDSLDISDANPEFIDDENTSSTSIANDSLTHFSSFDTSYTQTFLSEDSINSGTANSDYIWEYSISFENLSTDIADIFDVTLEYSYEMKAEVTGENADSEAIFEYSNEDMTKSGYDFVNASTTEIKAASASDSQSINFSLAAGELETFYFDMSFTGDLEATETSPVPVPAAFWLFGSALLAFPGLKKLKVTG